MQGEYLAYLAENGWLGRLSAGELRVIMVLIKHCIKSDTCWPSRKTIAAESGIPEGKLTGKSRPIDRLEQRGLISRLRGFGRHNATRYRLERGDTMPLFPIESRSKNTPHHGGDSMPETPPTMGVIIEENTPHHGGDSDVKTPPREVVKHPHHGGPKKLEERKKLACILATRNPNEINGHLRPTITELARDAGIDDADQVAEILTRNVGHLADRGKLRQTVGDYVASGIRSAQAGEPFALLAELRDDDRRSELAKAAELESIGWYRHRAEIAAGWIRTLDADQAGELLAQARKHHPELSPDLNPEDPAAAYAILTLTIRGGFAPPDVRASASAVYDEFSITRAEYAQLTKARAT